MNTQKHKFVELSKDEMENLHGGTVYQSLPLLAPIPRPVPPRLASEVSGPTVIVDGIIL